MQRNNGLAEELFSDQDLFNLQGVETEDLKV